MIKILFYIILIVYTFNLNAKDNLFRIYVSDIKINEENSNENNDNFTDWISFFENKCGLVSTSMDDLNEKLNQGLNISCNNVYSNPPNDTNLTQALNATLSMNLSDTDNSIFDYFTYVNSINIINSKSLTGFNKITSTNSVNLSNNNSTDVNLFSNINYIGNFNINGNTIDNLNLSLINLNRIDNLIVEGNIADSINLFNALSSSNSVLIKNNKSSEITFADNGNLSYLGNFTLENNEIDSFTGIPNGYIANISILNNPTLRTLNAFNNIQSAPRFEIKNNPQLNSIATNEKTHPFDNNANIILDNLGFINLDLNSIYPNIYNLPHLKIINNQKLIQINGMNNRDDMNFFGNVTIENNQLLKNITGFSGLLQNVDFKIINNPSLESIKGLKMQTVRGNIFIENNDSLLSIDSPLTEVNSDISIIIRNNPNLKTFRGFSNLANVSNFSFYLDSPSLESVELVGKEDCVVSDNNPINISPTASLSRGFNIKTYQSLKELKFFSNCKIVVNVKIDNTELESINFGENNHFYEKLEITNNNSLFTLDLLTKNVYDHGYLSSNYLKEFNLINNSLVSLNGLLNTEVEYINISNNNLLTNLNIFNNDLNESSFYSKKFEIKNNQNLVNISKINFTLVENLSIKENNSLTNLNGLLGINGINYLELIDNINLNDLSGLNNTNIQNSLILNEKNYTQKINNNRICGCLYANGQIFKKDGSPYLNRTDYCVNNQINFNCSIL